MHPKPRRRRWYILPALILVFLGWVSFEFWTARGPLPPDRDIVGMRAGFIHWSSERAGVEWFDVPASHRRAILRALRPVRVDPEPAKCVGVGSIDIRRSNGQQVWVSLFNSGYSIGDTHYEYPDDYSSVVEAIRAAQAETASEPTPDGSSE